MKEGEQIMGFVGWLLLLFIGLKITDFIGWPWWWVLSPIWVPALVFLVAGCLVLWTAWVQDKRQ